ncbi:MAG TPA: D-aminoacylase [Streptosporangiaceae bacterium]|nr:D-aminoacylase [Streptosporangiaceae bacterium]
MDVAADLVVRDAVIADGTGGELGHGDVAVRDGLVVSVGDEPAAAGPATVEIDAHGELVCAPGFIDVHTHDDAALVRYPGLEFKIAQGCTSLVIGNCGFSAFPGIGEDDIETIAAADWPDLNGFRADVTTRGFAANAMALIGHNTIRIAAIGRDEDRPATQAELALMRGHVRRAMEQGACGLSTGLIYKPGKWTSAEEIIELATAAGEGGGLYATHLRNEGDKLLESVAEAIRIGHESGCPVHISHHKASGEENWGKVANSLASVDQANAVGADVTLDFYPYTASSGPMAEYVSPDTVTQDWADRNLFATCPPFPGYQGRNVGEVAAAEGLGVADLVARVFATAAGRQTISIGFGMSADDLMTNIRHPLMMIGSDGIPDLTGLPHPRLFGTFPRIFAEYVRKHGLISTAEAVRRMTSLPADRFGLAGRGRLTPGFHADFVVFDQATIADVATYSDPKREPAGVHSVIVNGSLTYHRGRHTGARAGQLLAFRPPQAVGESPVDRA